MAPTSVRAPRHRFGGTPKLGSERLDRRTGTPSGPVLLVSGKGTCAQSPSSSQTAPAPRSLWRPWATFLSDRRYDDDRASEDIWRGQCKRSRVDLVCGAEDEAMTLFNGHLGRRLTVIGVAAASVVLGLEAPAFAVPRPSRRSRRPVARQAVWW